MEQHARNSKTGLLYHGWDESKQQPWADKRTGRSPHVWARAMGWYAMALLDVLEHFPKDHPRRRELVDILNREAAAIEKYQDAKSGVWWDIVDLGGREKITTSHRPRRCLFMPLLAVFTRVTCPSVM
jgi:unsaturated rhamnogalacturonyl hydrolase